MSIQLSICIPTFNFGRFIGETLESIIRQATDEVEIVVVDGGSTDNTNDVVAGFQSQFPRLRYVRLPAKGGIDKDMALSAELATGTYCWFFGADDLMTDGALAAVLRRTPSGDDVILVETTLCELDMKPFRHYRNLELEEERCFELADVEQRQQYFRLASNTQAFFSFCGAFVFRRERWVNSKWDESFIGSCWAHAARILALVPSGLRVRHIPGPLTLKRMGNDSFSDQGLANRLRIGIDGYLRIASVIFGSNTFEARQIRRALRNEYGILGMLSAKLITLREGTAADRLLMDDLFERLYDDWPLVARMYRYSPDWIWSALNGLRPPVRWIAAKLKRTP